ncbi:MAG: TonB-dependent receptor [Odoribacteraceae bacterium]|nr:TonB-dependent receptor [Odoribacteraceae bacterium]
MIWLLLSCPIALLGQGVVSGRVVSRDGSPVRGVHVVRVESGAGTTSDSLGRFRLECELPCTIALSHVGYREETRRVERHDEPFVVVLRSSDGQLEEVIVTAVTSAGNMRSTSGHIERVPAILGEHDVLKWLATLPGIITTNPFNSGVYVRGGNSHENGFLIHDMPIANPDHLTGILSTFDPYILGSSTLYKSGFPARYNGFLSSYLNMRPDAGGKSRHEGEATLGVVSSSLKTRGPLAKGVASYALSARSSYLRQVARLYNRGRRGEVEPNLMPEYAFSDVTAAVDASLPGRWRLGAFALFTTDRLNMKLSEHFLYRFKWHTLSGNVLSTRTRESGDEWTVQAGVKSAFSEGGSMGSVPMGGGNRYLTLMSRLSYSRVFPGGLRAGAGARAEYNRFETANREDGYGNVLIRSSDKIFRLYDIYLDLGFRVNDYLTLEGGVDYQYHDGEARTHEFSPRLKVSYAGRFVLWADFAKSVQYLGLYPYFTVKTPVDIWYPLGKGNRPATCYQYSVGASREMGQRFSAYAGLFYKSMWRVKDFTRDPGATYAASEERQIEGKGDAKGFEVDVAFHYRGLRAGGNYTLSESKRTFAEINDGQAFFPPYDVKHHVVLSLSWTPGRRLTMGALWNYSSGVNTTFPTGIVVAHNLADEEDRPVLIPVYKERYNYRLPPNHRLDVSVDYSFERGPFTFKVSAGAYNVYNQSNPSFVYFRPEEGEGGLQRLAPRSKVILPFIPHVSLRLIW